MDEGGEVEGGKMTVPSWGTGNSAPGSEGGASGTGNTGTGSSGGVNPGNFNVSPLIPGGANTPGSSGENAPGSSGENAPGSSGENTPGSSDAVPKLPDIPRKEGQAQRRIRKAKEAADYDPGFDCSIWGPSLNKMSRFCCTGGPPGNGYWEALKSRDVNSNYLISLNPNYRTLRKCCIDYDPRDSICFAPENRICGFCKVPKTKLAYNVFSPFYVYISTTTKLPNKYLPSPPTREISEAERNAPGREFWHGSQGSQKPGYSWDGSQSQGWQIPGDRSTKSTTCTKAYLIWHPYQTSKKRPSDQQSGGDEEDDYDCPAPYEPSRRTEHDETYGPRSDGSVGGGGDSQADLPADGGIDSQSDVFADGGSDVQADLPVDEEADQQQAQVGDGNVSG